MIAKLKTLIKILTRKVSALYIKWNMVEASNKRKLAIRKYKQISNPN